MRIHLQVNVLVFFAKGAIFLQRSPISVARFYLTANAYHFAHARKMVLLAQSGLIAHQDKNHDCLERRFSAVVDEKELISAVITCSFCLPTQTKSPLTPSPDMRWRGRRCAARALPGRRAKRPRGCCTRWISAPDARALIPRGRSRRGADHTPR